MCQHFVHGINRAKWDVEVAFAKELNVLKNVSHGVDQPWPFTKLKSQYLDRRAKRKMGERTIVVFRFSKEYLTIGKPQPVGSDIGWSVVPDLGHPYKVSEQTYSVHIHERHNNFYCFVDRFIMKLLIYLVKASPHSQLHQSTRLSKVLNMSQMISLHSH